MEPVWVPVGFRVKSFLLFCTQTTDTRLHPRWLLSQWRWCENLALTSPSGFICSWTELLQETKFSPEIPESHKTARETTGFFFWFFLAVVSVFVFITHVWNHGCFRATAWRFDCTKHSDDSEQLPPRLTCSVLQPRGRAPLKWCTEPASVVSSEVIGVNWQRRPCKANTRIVFCTPQQKA